MAAPKVRAAFCATIILEVRKCEDRKTGASHTGCGYETRLHTHNRMRQEHTAASTVHEQRTFCKGSGPILTCKATLEHTCHSVDVS